MKSLREIERKVRKPFYFYAGGGFVLYFLSLGIDSPVGSSIAVMSLFCLLAGAAFSFLIWRFRSILNPPEAWEDERGEPLKNMTKRQKWAWDHRRGSPWIWVPIYYFFIVTAGYPYLLVLNALVPIGPERVYSGAIVRKYVGAGFSLLSRHNSDSPKYVVAIQDRLSGELEFEVTRREYDLLKEGMPLTVPMRRGALGIPYRWNWFGIH